MRPWILGLTGGIGTGKTAVADLFASQGVAVVDSDQASRWVVAPGRPALDKIVERFGVQLLLPSGELNRPMLRQRIFAEPRERQWLEQLLHPLIRDEVDAHLARAHTPYAILVSPLLVEVGQRQRVQRLLVVDAPQALQLQRAIARDGATESQVRSILAAQASREDRLKFADDVLLNDKDFCHLASEVERLHRFYLTLKEGRS